MVEYIFSGRGGDVFFVFFLALISMQVSRFHYMGRQSRFIEDVHVWV